MIYVIFTELFSYVYNNKNTDLNKTINSRVRDLSILIQNLKAAVNKNRDIWENIQIILLLKNLSEEYQAKKDYILNIKNLKIINV